MVKVYVGNNVKRESKIHSPNKTLRAILEEANIDFSRGVMHLDGSTLGPGDLNKTLADFGYTGEEGKNTAWLLNVVKADNAA